MSRDSTGSDTLLGSAPPPSRSRRFVFALAAVLLGLVVGTGLAEVGIRLYYHQRPEGLIAHRRSFRASQDPLAVYEYRPGLTYGPHGLYHINRHGFRGPETTLEKPPGTFRIGCLGDSNTFGQGVDEEDTWVRQLERRLDARIPDRRIEVLNFGVQAYATRNELGLLRERALSFAPDMVLLGHLVNDHLPSFFRVVRGSLVSVFEEDPGRDIPLAVPVKEWLYRHSLLYRVVSVSYLRHYVVRRGGSFRDEKGVIPSQVSPPDPAPIDGDSIRAIASLCRERGIGLVILDFPLAQHGPNRHKSPSVEETSQHLRRLAGELAVPYVDLYPVLQGRDGEAYTLSSRDQHPNARLYRLYAKYLADQLEPRLRGMLGVGE